MPEVLDPLARKKKILLLTTGGTIASIDNHPKDGKSHLTSEELLEHITPLSEYYDIKTEGIFRQDSSNIQPDQWKSLAERIFERCGHYDGIVITHGTDTLAYTSSMLSFMLPGLPIPVVLTGAQIPLLHPVSDALSNLRCAFAMAASGTGGVFVAFHQKIMLGCHVVKSRSVSLNAFESVGSHCVACVTANGLLIHKERIPKQNSTTNCKTAICEKVFLCKMAPCLTPDIFDYAAKAGYQGVVIEAYGKGTIPTQDTAWKNALNRLTQQHIPVVVCGQCQLESKVEAPDSRCQDSQFIFAGDMTTEAAVTKLMWSLGQIQRADQEENKMIENVKKIFHGNLTGEKKEEDGKKS